MLQAQNTRPWMHISHYIHRSTARLFVFLLFVMFPCQVHPRMLPLVSELGSSQVGSQALCSSPCFCADVCVLSLNHTSHVTSVKLVKIHKGFCAIGGGLHHIILEVSTAWKNSIYLLARYMPAVQVLWQISIQGTVDMFVVITLRFLSFW